MSLFPSRSRPCLLCILSKHALSSFFLHISSPCYVTPGCHYGAAVIGASLAARCRLRLSQHRKWRCRHCQGCAAYCLLLGRLHVRVVLVSHQAPAWTTADERSKYPVIIGIIVVVLIVASIAWCAIRCCCCGLQCCCSCFSCFNACCPSPRGKERPRSSQGMARLDSSRYGPPPIIYAQPAFHGAQTATFDANSAKKNNNGGLSEDALPHMPSWDTATDKRVEDYSPDDHTDMKSQEQGLLDPTHAPPSGPPRTGEAASYFNNQQPSRSYAASPAPSRGYPTSPAPSASAAGAYLPPQRRVSPAPSAPYNYGNRAPGAQAMQSATGYAVSPAPPSYASSPYGAPQHPSTQYGAQQSYQNVGQRQGYRQVSDGWNPHQQQQQQQGQGYPPQHGW